MAYPSTNKIFINKNNFILASLFTYGFQQYSLFVIFFANFYVGLFCGRQKI